MKMKTIKQETKQIKTTTEKRKKAWWIPAFRTRLTLLIQKSVSWLTESRNQSRLKKNGNMNSKKSHLKTYFGSTFFFLTYFQFLLNSCNDGAFGNLFFYVIVFLDLSFINRRNPSIAFFQSSNKIMFFLLLPLFVFLRVYNYGQSWNWN